jgi:hypothetical protein
MTGFAGISLVLRVGSAKAARGYLLMPVWTVGYNSGSKARRETSERIDTR